MTHDLLVRTPCCDRSVRGVPDMSAATLAVRRTCPRCSRRYALTVEPVPVALDGMNVHALTWVPLPTGRR